MPACVLAVPQGKISQESRTLAPRHLFDALLCGCWLSTAWPVALMHSCHCAKATTEMAPYPSQTLRRALHGNCRVKCVSQEANFIPKLHSEEGWKRAKPTSSTPSMFSAWNGMMTSQWCLNLRTGGHPQLRHGLPTLQDFPREPLSVTFNCPKGVGPECHPGGLYLTAHSPAECSFGVLGH